MKKVIAIIIAFVVLLYCTSVHVLAEDAYIGATPYDATGNCPAEILELCAKGGEAIYGWLGVRTITYIAPSYNGLEAESYAEIVCNILESVIGKTDDVMLVLADAELNDLHIWRGEEYAQYFTDEEVAKCTEAPILQHKEDIYNKVSTFYMAVSEVLVAKEYEIESMRTKKEPAGSLDAELMEQPMYVQDAKLIVQSDEYKSLYPDLLSATFVNNSDQDIRDVVIAYVAWDSNNLPVLIRGQFDFNAPTYVKQANYNGVNMVPGSTFGETSGLKLDESVQGIVTVKAIVASYETFDGVKWSNPIYDQFIDKYAGKKLSQD